MKNILPLFCCFLFFSCDSELDNIVEEESLNFAHIQEITEDLRSGIENDPTFEENILILVDHEILEGTQANIKRFIRDINASQQNVFLETEIELDVFETKSIIENYSDQNQINGCIFLGDIPIPKARFSSPFNETFKGVSTQFYMDLDGGFEFDDDLIIGHTGETSIEIWVSVIPSYGNDPIANINNYLEKNHDYREGRFSIEQGFVNSLIGAQIENEETYDVQLDYLVNEIFVDLNQRGNLFIGIDNTLNDSVQFPNAEHVYEYELLTDKYDVAKIGAHGSSVAFGSFDEWGSIIINVEYARTRNIQPMLLIETSCNSAAIDKSVNLACEFLFNPNNNVVSYSGATAPQGGMGETEFGRPSNFISERLVEGSLIGEALLAPMYHKYEDGVFNDFRDYFSAQQVVLGDGSLRLQEFM